MIAWFLDKILVHKQVHMPLFFISTFRDARIFRMTLSDYVLLLQVDGHDLLNHFSDDEETSASGFFLKMSLKWCWYFGFCLVTLRLHYQFLFLTFVFDTRFSCFLYSFTKWDITLTFLEILIGVNLCPCFLPTCICSWLQVGAFGSLFG